MPPIHPDLAVLDQDHLDRQTFGDHGLAHDLLLLFLGQCDRFVPVIATEPSGRRDAAHALLGAARAIGAARVAALAEAIEAAASGAEHDPDEAALGHLVVAIEDVRSVVDARLGDRPAGRHLAKPRRVA